MTERRTVTDRAKKLMGFEALGLLAGSRRAGTWSGELPEITGLSVDSRRTEKGHLFAALPGSNAHGASFIPFALRMGAAASARVRRGVSTSTTGTASGPPASASASARPSGSVSTATAPMRSA